MIKCYTVSFTLPGSPLDALKRDPLTAPNLSQSLMANVSTRRVCRRLQGVCFFTQHGSRTTSLAWHRTQDAITRENLITGDSQLIAEYHVVSQYRFMCSPFTGTAICLSFRFANINPAQPTISSSNVAFSNKLPSVLQEFTPVS